MFFRHNVNKLANKLGLDGFVKNKQDGTVEVVAQGHDEKIQELLDFCRKGPMFAKVIDTGIKEEKPNKEFSGFEVRY